MTQKQGRESMHSGNNFTDEIFYLSKEKNLDAEVEKLFKYYRNLGYPNYSKENYSLYTEYEKLKKFDVTGLIKDATIKQNLTGIGILWTYFPHWVDVKCGADKKSLQELWNDDENLKKLIKKTYVWKLKHNEPHWTHNRIRQNAKVFLSGQSVSNFRPTVAKFIYDTYGNKGKVLDMSAGFGGRLFGFSASNCKEYVGFDPSTKTYSGLVNLKNDLFNLVDKKITIRKQGSEIFDFEYVNYFDLCFTSPPYFDTEKYSDEKSQSYIKYPTLDKWINGFLKDTIENCYDYTKVDGYVIFNISNTKVYNNLEEDLIKLAENTGLELITTYKMELSSISGNKRKYEPIFVFKKH